MSGRAVDKPINANKKQKNTIINSIVPSDIDYTDISEFTKRRLWRFNNIMFLFHTAFCITTLTVGKLNLMPSIYGISLSANRTMSSIKDYSSFTLENAPKNWESEIEDFLRVSTKKLTYGLPMTWLVAIFFFLSAFFHFGNANIWWKNYIYYLEREQSPYRWIEYTFSASTMILIVAYGSGIRIETELFMVYILIATTMFFGHLTETINKKSTTGDFWVLPLRQRLTPHFMGYVPQISAWAVIVYTFSMNSEGAPPFVTVIVWTELVLFFSFGFVQLAVCIRKPSKYVQGEIAYQVLSLVSKGFLGVILLTNVIFLEKWPCIVEEISKKVPSGYC